MLLANELMFLQRKRKRKDVKKKRKQGNILYILEVMNRIFVLDKQIVPGRKAKCGHTLSVDHEAVALSWKKTVQ